MKVGEEVWRLLDTEDIEQKVHLLFAAQKVLFDLGVLLISAVEVVLDALDECHQLSQFAFLQL